MKIEVKIKPGDCQSPTGGIIAMVLFLGVSLGQIAKCILEIEGAFSLESFMKVMSKDGMLFLVGIFCLLIALYFLKCLIAAPKSYRAVLKGMETGTFKGKNVTWLGLAVEKDQKRFPISSRNTGFMCRELSVVWKRDRPMWSESRNLTGR